MTSGKLVNTWRAAYPGGPAKAYHVGCVLSGTLYVHGGIDTRSSTKPLSTIFSLDTSTWREETAPGSPALSHHACVGIDDRYMVLIGGWDGHKRTENVYVYDAKEHRWHACVTSGFPTGAGLSSHTATLLTSGEILIIGREGSLRTQRRQGNAFILNVNTSTWRCTYKTYGIGVDSRSGHTITGIGSVMYVIGGRSDKLVDVHSGLKCTRPAACDQLDRLAAVARESSVLAKPPCGRKHHIAIGGGGGVILIQGGETFDGRSKGPVGDTLILLTKPHMRWVKLPDTSLCRAGHICVCFDNNIVIHGGEETQTRVHNEVYKLDI